MLQLVRQNEALPEQRGGLLLLPLLNRSHAEVEQRKDRSAIVRALSVQGECFLAGRPRRFVVTDAQPEIAEIVERDRERFLSACLSKDDHRSSEGFPSRREIPFGPGCGADTREC